MQSKVRISVYKGVGNKIGTAKTVRDVKLHS